MTVVPLAKLITAINGTLDTSVTIQRVSSGTWATVATTRCRFYQSNIIPQENPSSTQRLYIDDRWRFILPVGTNVIYQDRLVVGSRTWEVIQVPIPSLVMYVLVLAQEIGA
jgi:hypothetical protein